MVPGRLVDYLDSERAEYVVMAHSPAFTAQCIAGLAHIPGKELAKTVVVKLDGKMALAVVPAMCRVDLELLRRATGAGSAVLATEEEFFELFPECETGAMPPFGNMYGMATYADESLTLDKEIAFNAGTHRELIRIRWTDYVRLARPEVLRFAAWPRAEAA